MRRPYTIIIIIMASAVVIFAKAGIIYEGDFIVPESANTPLEPIINIEQNNYTNSDDIPVIADTEATAIINTANSQTQLNTAQDTDTLPINTVSPEPPFTTQAPLASWDDARLQDGCEEAASLMAVYWARNQTLTLTEAKAEIIAASDYQAKNWQEYRDTSLQDTLDRIIKGYFHYDSAYIVHDITAQNIIDAVQKNYLVIVPTNGQKLHNPYFTPPGPERHNVLIHGYDNASEEFIVHDPGTVHGHNYRYKKNILYNAIMDYPTGHHEFIEKIVKNAIIITK